MNSIQSYSKNPLVVVIAGAVAGLVLGLLIGWVLWPVEYVNGGPNTLSPEWQNDFLRMAIASYDYYPDAGQAQERYDALGDTKEEVLADITQNPGELDPLLISSFTAAVTGAPVTAVTEAPGAVITGTQTIVTPPGVEGAAPLVTEEAAAPETEEGGGGWTIWILLSCLLLIVLFGALAYFLFFRDRFAKSTSGPTPATIAAETRKQTELTDYSTTGVEPPVSQFMASYRLGDDLFDDSFSIDSQTGEFLGECGVGISETIGVGDPKKVTAFEVWLFDKNDIQTVTKVLMSEHAFNDVSVRNRLEAKGEPVLARAGEEFTLETQTLQMVARVVDMGYGDGAMPDDSFFENLLLELAIWQKPQV